MQSGPTGSQLARYDLDRFGLWKLNVIWTGWLLNVWSQSRWAGSLLAGYNLGWFGGLNII